MQLMNGLHRYQLNTEETILFGPAQKIREATPGYKYKKTNGLTQNQMRTVVITNQRIVIEAGDSCITVPNNDVVRLDIKQNSSKNKNLSSFNLVQAYSRSGRKVLLDIPGVNPNQENLLSEIFPNASIQENNRFRTMIDNWLK